MTVDCTPHEIPVVYVWKAPLLLKIEPIKYSLISCGPVIMVQYHLAAVEPKSNLTDAAKTDNRTAGHIRPLNQHAATHTCSIFVESPACGSFCFPCELGR